jgi:tetratricopeptide (TPR) repeat protein
MKLPVILRLNSHYIVRVLGVALLVILTGINGAAQYGGAPVQLEKLVRALRSKQLQSQDMVTVINSNGVNFRLTAYVRSTLVAAGARPEVLRAIANNQRNRINKGATFAGRAVKDGQARSKEFAYNDLLEKAMYSYEEQKNAAGAVRYLQTAIKMKPHDPKAFQIMGYVNLYGLENLEDARRYMKESISNGGSAVFRVYHDDSGNFTGRCSGSLYISPDTIRFESDDNIHTFETSTASIQSVKSDSVSSKVWKKYPVFNVNLKFGKEKAKFRFAPMSGTQVESNMATYFISQYQSPMSKAVSLAINR